MYGYTDWVYSGQGLLLNVKMLETADSLQNISESQKYFFQKKPDTEESIYMKLEKHLVAWGQGGKAGVEVLIGETQGNIWE